MNFTDTMVIRNAYTIVVRNPEGKRPRGRPEPRWKDYIKMNLIDTGCEGTDWIQLAQERSSGERL